MAFFKPNPRKEIEKIEKQLDWIKLIILKKHGDFFECPELEDIRNAFYEMEKKYLRLKERYKYDIKTLLQIVGDWLNYVAALSHLTTAELGLTADLEEGAGERYAEAKKEPLIVKEEIEKRFNDLLKVEVKK